MADEMYAIKGSSLTAIADAIREKTGDTGTMRVDAMPSAIRGISGDSAWGALQVNGTRTNYQAAFAYTGWDVGAFKPKYDFKVDNAQQMFWHTNNKSVGTFAQLDLIAVEEECGITFDFSNCTTFYLAFGTGGISRLGTVDMTNSTSNGMAFYGAYDTDRGLKEIRRLIVGEKTTFQNNTFQSCNFLETVGFEGTLASDLDIHWSTLLTHDSLISLLNCLKDGVAHTLTLGETNLNKLTTEEKYIAINKGWTLAGYTPINPNEYTVQGDSYEICEEYEDDGSPMYVFISSPGHFWHNNGQFFAADDVISFSGDSSGQKYVVTRVKENGGRDYEHDVYFNGTYTPADGDTVTKWLKP